MKMKTMLVMLLQQKGMGMKAMLTKRCVLKYKVWQNLSNILLWNVFWWYKSIKCPTSSATASTLIMLTLADHMPTLALIMLVLNADADHGDVGADLPGRGDGGGWGDYGRLRHPGGEKLHVLKLCPPKSWSRTKSSKCKKKPSQDGSTILLQPKLASGFISHPNRFSKVSFRKHSL